MCAVEGTIAVALRAIHGRCFAERGAQLLIVVHRAIVVFVAHGGFENCRTRRIAITSGLAEHPPFRDALALKHRIAGAVRGHERAAALEQCLNGKGG